MKKLICLILALCLLLCGCGGSGETTATTTEATTEATTEPTTEATTEPTEATTEPVVLYTSPLTGMPLSEPMTNRPYAVVLNNINVAQPLHGLSQADVLFEIVAEGGGSITRCLGIFSDIEQVTKIGSIRSARTYLIDLANSMNAIFVHAGGSTYAYSELNAGAINNLDGLKYGNYFYRDQERKNAGYALEHTLFSSGDRLVELTGTKGYKTGYDEPIDYGFQFSDAVELTGESAKRIEMHFSGKGGKGTIFAYEEATGLYIASQKFGSKAQDWIDGNTETPISFKNVITMFAKTTSNSEGRMFATLTGEGTGYYACNGKYVPIKWSRSSDTDPFTYTLEDGTPITLGVGNTYVGVLSTKSPITFE